MSADLLWVFVLAVIGGAGVALGVVRNELGSRLLPGTAFLLLAVRPVLGAEPSLLVRGLVGVVLCAPLLVVLGRRWLTRQAATEAGQPSPSPTR